MPKSYDASDIDVLQGLEPVRLKIGMYLGSADKRGRFHACKELLDNAGDEARASEGMKVYVNYDAKTDTLTVGDNGRGIPIETHKVTKKSTLETVFTTLHAGGKLKKGGSYGKGTSGTHGVGASATMAVSKYFQVWTYRSKRWYTQEYAKGKVLSSVKESKTPTTPWGQDCGTVVSVQLDETIFDNDHIPEKEILEWMDLQAYLHPGMELYFYRNGTRMDKFYQPKGVQMLLSRMIKRAEAEPLAKEALFAYSDGEVDVALQWSTYTREDIKSYVCGSHTGDGGTHEKGFDRALEKILEDFAPRGAEVVLKDFTAGMHAVLNVNIEAPAFTGQTKDKLATKEAYELVKDRVYDALRKWAKANKKHLDDVITRAIEFHKASTRASENRALIALGKTTRGGRSQLPDKLNEVPGISADKRELYLLEGDSAAGTVGQTRDSKSQEALPLRGKILNVWKVKGKDDASKAESLEESEEIVNIIRSIGLDLASKDPLSKLRTKKIVLMMDPDPDGAHIESLVVGALQYLAPQLFEKGYVWRLDAQALFKVQAGGKYYWDATIEALLKRVPKGYDKATLGRIKGWGEAPLPMVREMAMDPKRRSLARIEPSVGKDLDRFMALVGDDPVLRREVLGIRELE